MSCIPAEKSGHLSSSPTHGTCPRHPPEHSDAPRWMIYPTQQVKRPGAKVGLASPRAASLLSGGAAQRRMETYLVGLVLHGQLWTRCALLPVLSGNSFMSCSILTVGGPTADLKRVSDLQRAAFTVPFGAFVGVKIIKLNVQRSRPPFVSPQLSLGRYGFVNKLD